MSAQFGRWNFDGKPVDRDYVEKVTHLLYLYGPDGRGSYSKGNISILYHAFHTTKESKCEKQPCATASGAVLTWDGRLDNRDDLIHQLVGALGNSATDVEIVAAAYDDWGSDCFAMLIGDWALSIWDPRASSLLLAKDPIGTRHLYYSLGKDQVTWSTILDPLVLFAEGPFSLREEYIAGWFSFSRRLISRLMWEFKPSQRLPMCSFAPESASSPSIGILILASASVTKPTRNTKNTSAASRPSRPPPASLR